MTIQITNVKIDARMGSKVALSWELLSFGARGPRFHVWIDPADLAEYSFTACHLETWVFKNPPLGSKAGDDDYFDTRKLNPQSKPNQAMIEAALTIARTNDLYSKLEASEAAEREKIAAEDRASALVQQARNAAPAMLAALEAIDADILQLATLRVQTIDQLRAALRQARG